MRRVQSLEFNQNSSLSLTDQPKKVSLPLNNDVNVVPKRSSSWFRRSVPTMTNRNTVVPLTLIDDDIPDYFESSMQAMSLAFFTFAYTELIEDAVFVGQTSLLPSLLQFLTILCLGLTLLASFASIRISIIKSSTRETSKIYSTFARIASIVSGLTCALIICLFAAVSLYTIFRKRSNEFYR